MSRASGAPRRALMSAADGRLTARQRVGKHALERAAVPQPPGCVRTEATREELVAQVNELRAKVCHLESRLDRLAVSQKQGWGAYFREKEGMPKRRRFGEESSASEEVGRE